MKILSYGALQVENEIFKEKIYVLEFKKETTLDIFVVVQLDIKIKVKKK